MLMLWLLHVDSNALYSIPSTLPQVLEQLSTAARRKEKNRSCITCLNTSWNKLFAQFSFAFLLLSLVQKNLRSINSYRREQHIALHRFLSIYTIQWFLLQKESNKSAQWRFWQLMSANDIFNQEQLAISFPMADLAGSKSHFPSFPWGLFFATP